MTQNPYQQGPPQGYPQQPPAGPPPYQPAPGQGGYPGQNPYQQVPPQEMSAPAQQYPPPPGYAPQGPPPGYPQQPPAQSTQAGTFGDPDERPPAGDQPTIPQLATSRRLVLVKPLRWNKGGTEYKSDVPQEQMIVDMIVCDGEPIAGSEDFISKVVTPFAAGPKVAPFFVGQIMVNKAILDRLRSTLDDPTAPDVVLGRLSSNQPKSGSGYPWWNLEKATEQEKAHARTIFPRWAELEAAARTPQQAQYGPPQGGYVVPPPGYAQAPGQPYPGQPYAQPAPQGPPPGYGAPPAGYPQQPAYPPPY